MTDSGENPDVVSSTMDTTDPGDDVQRRFRYQHAYGVILWLRCLESSPEHPVAIRCEHHEDIILEFRSSHYEAYQIKTRQEGEHKWRIDDRDVAKSIRRFCDLYRKFPNNDLSFKFVSNYPFENRSSRGGANLERCPSNFLQAIKNSKSHDAIPEHFSTVFKGLIETESLDADTLFVTLQRTTFVRGPSLNDFPSVVAHEHLPRISECVGLEPAMLNSIRDDLIMSVFNASSLGNIAPEQHWTDCAADDTSNPLLRAKRLSADELSSLIRDKTAGPSFRFAPQSTKLPPLSSLADKRLTAKLQRGGLGHHTNMFRRRAISAHQHLMRLTAIDPESSERKLDQILSAVESDGTDAHIDASSGGSEPFGAKMYTGLETRLRRRVLEDPRSIESLNYDCLSGVAGILTGECKMWWSHKFDLGIES